MIYRSDGMAMLILMQTSNKALRNHGCRILLLLLALVAIAAAPAQAKTYSAERFDSHVQVLPGGAIEVTETVVFRFEDGTFSFVYRDLPRRRTDSIQVLRASMDGREMPFGTEAGQVEIRRKSGVRVRWNFPAPVSESTHTFAVTYRAEGVVRQSDEGDLLAWRALPGEHNYRIGTTTIAVAYPVPLARPAELETRRVNDVRIDESGQTVRVTGSNIGKNGWVETWLYFAPGSVIPAAPAWQQTERRANELAPRWMLAAGVIFVAGLLLFWSMRQRYDAPPPVHAFPGGVAGTPDDFPPAIAGALASNGRVSHVHAIATLVSLADRGAISIKEEPRGMVGQRDFTLERRRMGRPLSHHEQAALEIAFKDKDRQDDTVRLSRASRRLGSHFKQFRSALYEDMASAGLIDRDRKTLHGQLGAMSLVILLLGAALFIAAALLVREYRGWPLLPPAALMAAGILGFIFQGATTPLSNEGVRRAAHWRGYQKYLKEVARSRAHLTADSPAAVLPFALSLGLAAAWAKFVKTHPAAVPPWFSALSSSSSDAFPAFISYGGATGGGAGAGGAAGGGGSGAG
jgi:Predicted membrane protein (DUF2207)